MKPHYLALFLILIVSMNAFAAKKKPAAPAVPAACQEIILTDDADEALGQMYNSLGEQDAKVVECGTFIHRMGRFAQILNEGKNATAIKPAHDVIAAVLSKDKVLTTHEGKYYIEGGVPPIVPADTTQAAKDLADKQNEARTNAIKAEEVIICQGRGELAQKLLQTYLDYGRTAEGTTCK